MLNFKLQGSALDLSMMRQIYKLTIKTTKTEKTETQKILKRYNIINFKTIRQKLTASGNIIQQSLIKSLKSISILRLPKE